MTQNLLWTLKRQIMQNVPTPVFSREPVGEAVSGFWGNTVLELSLDGLI